MEKCFCFSVLPASVCRSGLDRVSEIFAMFRGSRRVLVGTNVGTLSGGKVNSIYFEVFQLGCGGKENLIYFKVFRLDLLSKLIVDQHQCFKWKIKYYVLKCI